MIVHGFSRRSKTTFTAVLSYSTADNKITTDITGIANDTLLYAFDSSDATNTNILGSTVEFPIYMEPEMEGVMMVFPSSLHHQVYPFYNTEEPRISISGNLLWNMVECKQDLN